MEIELKHCNKCGNDYPKTEEYFYKQKTRHGTITLKSECKKCTKKAYKEWRKNNPDKVKENCKRQSSKKERKIYVRRYAKEQRENGYQKKYQQNNPDKMKIYNQRRQHKKHKITKQEWLACKNYFNNECAYCGLSIENHFRKFKGKLQKIDFHKEHVNHFGADDLSNCVPSCMSCNSHKWEFLLKEWYNKDNINFTKERLDKIYKWISNDYIIYMNCGNTRLVDMGSLECFKQVFETIKEI